MKKLILAMVLILTLTFVFVGCNKDKETTEPTTTEKVSTTEPTTKFEAPEIKDEPTTEETTEETEASAPETTKKPVYSSNSGSSSGSSNSGSSSKPSSKPATTKAPATTKNNSHLTDDSITPLVTNSSGGGIFLIGDGKGDELKEEDIGSADDWEPDPEMDGWGEGGMLE